MGMQNFIRELKKDENTKFSDKVSNKDDEHVCIIPPDSSFDETKNNMHAKDTYTSANTQSMTNSHTVVSAPPTDKAILKDNVQSQVDVLFERSGTHELLKSVWLDYYNKASESKKKNSVAQSMKAGRFRVIQLSRNNYKILILPEYDIRDKTLNQILSDKWL